jgi:integrase
MVGLDAQAGTGLKELRDRALLLIGFAGVFRRSELVALNVEDIEETADGLRITIRESACGLAGACGSGCDTTATTVHRWRLSQRVSAFLKKIATTVGSFDAVTDHMSKRR